MKSLKQMLRHLVNTNFKYKEIKAPESHRTHKMTVCELSHNIFNLPKLYWIVYTSKLLNKI